MADSLPVSSPMEAYQAYMVPVEFEPWADELLARVPLRPGDEVLDVACGTGVVARRAAQKIGASGSVTAVDANPAMLDAARALPPPDGAPVQWVQARAEQLPCADGVFDLVLSQQGIQFFSDRDRAVVEMRRVLRAGGRAGVSVWCGSEHQSVKGALIRALQEMFGPGAGVAYSFGDSAALKGLFHAAGFHNVRVETVQREMREPSAERMVRMLIMGASAAVPELARASADEREIAIHKAVERIRADLDAVRVADGIAYTMRSHVLLADA